MAGATAFGLNAQSFAGGAGTASDPWQVATAEQLKAVNDFPTAYFIQTADIDLDGAEWQPMCGSKETSFKGVYDGNGKAILGLSITSGANGAGLFGIMHTPGVIRNVTIVGAEVVAGNWSGILVGTNGNWEVAGGTVENCAVFNSQIDGADCIGGIAGVDGGDIKDCRVINCDIMGSADNCGGVVGTNEQPCEISGNVFSGTVQTLMNAGGIQGHCASNAVLKNNMSYGSAMNNTSDNKGVAGIVGYKNNNSTLYHCGSAMDLEGTNAGGISGPTMNDVYDCFATGNIKTSYPEGGNPWCGGITAAEYDGTLSNSYFSGTIQGGGWNGGVTGRAWPTLVVTNCYWNADGVSAGSNGVGGAVVGDKEGAPETWTYTALTPAQMLQSSSFKNLSSDVWQQIDGGTTPFFVDQAAPLVPAETNEAKTYIAGTYYGNDVPTEIWVIGATSGGKAPYYYKSFEAGEGKWAIELDEEDALLDNEYVTVISYVKGKMSSLPAKVAVKDLKLTDGLQAVGIDPEAAKLSVEGNIVTVPGGAATNVYTVSGMMVQSYTGAETIDLSNLGQGIYVVRTATDAAKVLVK